MLVKIDSRCEIVLINENLYRQESPPLQLDGTETEVLIRVTILRIGSFQEIEMTFKVKFLIELEW
jgi:hypothetical protein